MGANLSILIVLTWQRSFNIILKTTAAESAWSNVLIERHNGIIASMMDRVVADVGCKVNIALHWSVAAKNSLANVSGFSPNMLVFGRNISFPSGMNNKPPANNQKALNRYVADILNAIQCARLEFVRQEALEKLRRALNRKSRTYSDVIYHSGDMVYFKRNSSKTWHGPAKVIGKDCKQILLKQGGLYIWVHPCRLQHCGSLDSGIVENEVHGAHNSPETDVSSGISSAVVPNEMEVIRHHDSVDSTNANSSTAIENSVDDYPSAANNETVDDSDAVTSSHAIGSDNVLSSLPLQSDVGPSETNVIDSSNLPKVGSSIAYKTEDSDWRNAKILGRGGKAKGKYWHYMNVQNDNESEPKSISFRDEVTNWSYKDIEEAQFIECFIGTSSNKKRFDEAKYEELAKW